jgi:hypothetical protein
MGLDTSSIMLLLRCKSMHVNFESTATIGRQGLWPDHEMLQRVFAVQALTAMAEAFLEQHQYGKEVPARPGRQTSRLRRRLFVRECHDPP